MAYNSTHTGAEIDAAVDLVNSQKQELTPLKLNKCKIRVGDKITALYIGNPQGENYTDSGEQTNVIKVTDEEGNTYNLIDSFGHHNTYKNSVFTGGDIYDVGSQSHIIADWSLIKIAQRLVFGGNDSMDTNRNLILYFTEPLKIASAPTSNSHFDEDFQGIVAFTNTDRVNTGTFDPTSDNPAGQKSTAETLVDKDTYYATAMVGRFSGAFIGPDQAADTIFPDMSHYTSMKNIFNGATFYQRDCSMGNLNNTGVDFSYAFTNTSFFDFWNNVPLSNGRIFFANGRVSFNFTFFGCKAKEILVNEGATCKVTRFFYCLAYSSCEEIGAFDLSECYALDRAFWCDSLSLIHCKNFRVSFDISYSTRFTESALVEIIGNLMDLTGKSSQTLTMGATNLAKLTDAEKAVAVNKNWALA